MKAMILAAGKGTRLGHLTNHLPKPMLPLGGRPLLEHIVELLRRHNLIDIAINLHHQPDAILRHFGSGEVWGVRLRYSYEASLLGSAGTALRHLAWVHPDPFVVYYGDVYSDVNLSEMIAAHLCGGMSATIAVHQVADPSQCGIVEFDRAGRALRFVEKPRPDQVFSNWANSGIYVLSPEVLRFVTDIPADFGHDVFPAALAAGWDIQVYPVRTPLIDIGTPENYRLAQQLLDPAAAARSALERIDITPAAA